MTFNIAEDKKDWIPVGDGSVLIRTATTLDEALVIIKELDAEGESYEMDKYDNYYRFEVSRNLNKIHRLSSLRAEKARLEEHIKAGKMILHPSEITSAKARIEELSNEISKMENLHP